MRPERFWGARGLGRRLRSGVLSLLLLPFSLTHTAAQEARTLLSGALLNHPAIMLLVEPDSGGIIDANLAAATFYGYSREHLRTLPIEAINVLGPDEVAAERARARAADRNTFIFPHKKADGEIRTVEVSSAPLRDAGGQVLLLSIIHDITGQQTADSQSTLYLSRLEELVDRRTTQALEAQTRLRFWLVVGLLVQSGLLLLLLLAYRRRQTMLKTLSDEVRARRVAEGHLAAAKADLQRFAEVSAHHLQEPARRLVSFAQRLKQRLKPSPPDSEVATTLGFIEEQARTLRNLLRDVQLYLAADQPLSPQSCTTDSTAVFQEALRRLGPELEAARAVVTLATLAPIPLDPGRFARLAQILLINAIQYRQPAVPLHLAIHSERERTWTRIRVADNGVGIAPQYRERVFRVFERLRPVAGDEGTGIGLAIVRRIMESIGGKVWIEETVGGGTTMICEFPELSSPAAATEKHP